MADTATFSAAMKTKLIGPIRDHLPKGMVLLFGEGDDNVEGFKGIKASAEHIDAVGNEFRIPYKQKRNNSVGFRSENETLPAPGSSKYSYLTEPQRHHYSLFNITGQLLKASESSEGAFKAAFKEEMDDTLTSAKLDVNRAAHGDGTGAITAIRNNAASGASTVDVQTTVNFRGGEIIDFVAANGTVLSAAHEVVGVDRANRAITVSPALAAAVTTAAIPVRASADSTTSVPNNSFNKEIQGLKSIVSDSGTLHGINPVAEPQWKSYVKNVGGAISDAVLRDAKDAVGFEQGLSLDQGGLDFAIVTTRGIRRRYADTLMSYKRFNDAQAVKLHGGFTVLMFDENPIFVDDQVDPGTVYGLALNRLFWAQLADWDWMEQDGKVLKWESRKDRYIAILYKYFNLGTTHRGAHFKLTGVTDDTR